MQNTTDMAFPPGTVRLEDLHQQHVEVILQPQPSSDPNDPLNWPTWRKHLNFGLVSLYVVVVFALINMMPVTWGPMAVEYSSFTFDVLNNSYAAGCGALCLGGVVLIPFALKYGRRPVYILSLLLEAGIAVWSARIHNAADLMLVNILSCFVGALCEIMVQMTVADVYFVHNRGMMNSIYVWLLTVGSALAPLAAGFVSVNPSLGWRWVWWITAILLGVCVVLFFFLYEETKYDCQTLRGVARPATTEPTSQHDTCDETSKHPELQTTDTTHKQDPESSAVSSNEPQHAPPLTRITIDPTLPRKTYIQKLALLTPSPTPLLHYVRHLYQPFTILLTIPAVLYMSILNGAVFAASIMAISVTATYMTLPPYNFTPSQIGLMGLPSFIGVFLGATITGWASDALILRLARRNKTDGGEEGIYEPEMRLWLILAATPFLAAGYLLFGIGLDRGLPWPVVAVGLGIASFGSAAPMSLSLTYLTDAYTEVSFPSASLSLSVLSILHSTRTDAGGYDRSSPTRLSH